MRIGVLSDTHQPNDSPKSCLPQKLIEAFKDVDMIIHAGDIGDPACLDALKKMCPDVRAVWGNMDSAQTQMSLPEKLVFKAGSHTIGVTHGWGNPARLVENVGSLFKDDKVDIIVFGHSHTPVQETHNGILFFNPGSPTDKVFASRNSCGIIEINGSVHARIITL